MLLVVEHGREHEVEAVFEKWDLHAVQGRRGHRRHAAEDLRARHAGGRRAEPRADRRGAGLSAADGRCRRGRRASSELSFADLGAAAVGAAGVRSAADRADDRQQALGLSPVRSLASAPTPSRSPACRRRWFASRTPHAGWRCRSTATAASVISIRIRARMLAVAEAARNVACAGAEPIGATNNLNFGNPERPEIMWQIGEVGARHRRRLPGAGHADHRRQRQPLQRNRRPRDLPDTGTGRRRHARGRVEDRRPAPSRRPAPRWCCWAIISVSLAAASTWRPCTTWWPASRRRST